ncbi:MAG: hypothetical protein DME46_04240 [Verrucomicrobia bacterium]|nr:MAG: hypothetical protein DME46_04240 [Verrucomicrobiota bacterium]
MDALLAARAQKPELEGDDVGALCPRQRELKLRRLRALVGLESEVDARLGAAGKNRAVVAACRPRHGRNLAI